jgi:uncharacterized protein (DUF2062 family)
VTSLSRIRQTARDILHLNETPRRTATAFAVGVFIAFSPTYGLHTLSALGAAWVFRLNLVAVMAGSFINNPWTIVPILGATFWTGFALMGMPDVPQVEWASVTPETLYREIAPYIVPFAVGGLALSVLGAVLAYAIALPVITRVRRRPGRPDCDPPGPALT